MQQQISMKTNTPSQETTNIENNKIEYLLIVHDKVKSIDLMLKTRKRPFTEQNQRENQCKGHNIIISYLTIFHAK